MLNKLKILILLIHMQTDKTEIPASIKKTIQDIKHEAYLNTHPEMALARIQELITKLDYQVTMYEHEDEKVEDGTY